MIARTHHRTLRSYSTPTIVRDRGSPALPEYEYRIEQSRTATADRHRPGQRAGTTTPNGGCHGRKVKINTDISRTGAFKGLLNHGVPRGLRRINYFAKGAAPQGKKFHIDNDQFEKRSIPLSCIHRKSLLLGKIRVEEI